MARFYLRKDLVTMRVSRLEGLPRFLGLPKLKDQSPNLDLGENCLRHFGVNTIHYPLTIWYHITDTSLRCCMDFILPKVVSIL